MKHNKRTFDPNVFFSETSQMIDSGYLGDGNYNHLAGAFLIPSKIKWWEKEGKLHVGLRGK